MYTEVENKSYLYLDKNNQPNLPLTTPFIKKRKNIDHSMHLSFRGLFELLHADIVGIRFLAKSSKILSAYYWPFHLKNLYLSHEKKKSFFFFKKEQFYNNVSEKRKGKGEIRLQIDQEFQWNHIKRRNMEFNIKMFFTRVRGGKAFAAEQKIREFKKFC